MSTAIIRHEQYACVRVEPDMVQAMMPTVVEFLDQAIEATEGFSTVYQMLEAMQESARPWQMWLVMDGGMPKGALITSISAYGDNEKEVIFELIAGRDAQDWISGLLKNFEAYMAFMYGCTSARIVGRRGWERFMARHGYEPTHFVTRKRLLSPDGFTTAMIGGPNAG